MNMINKKYEYGIIIKNIINPNIIIKNVINTNVIWYNNNYEYDKYECAMI